MKRQTRQLFLSLYEAFEKSQIQLHSATLTYYTLLTLVPIFALLLIAAQPFQLEQFVEEGLRNLFKEQPQISNYLINFSHNTLYQTQTVAFKITGIALLLWAAIGMLSYIDLGINQLWKTPFTPNFLKRNGRLLLMLLICPVLFTIASGITLSITMAINYLYKEEVVLSGLFQIILFLSNIFPSLLTFCLLSFLYYFVPYVKVSLRHALWAGFITAIIYQLVQYGYFALQISVASYNAIYGTFAAIPLFLVWVHLSWMIFLSGAKLCYAFSHKKNHIPS